MKAAPIQPGTLCTNCGYDLAGLQETGVCPECAQECAVTIEHYRSLSQKYDPYHIICRGMKKLHCGYLVLAATLLAFIILPRIAAFAHIMINFVLFFSLCCVVMLYIAGILEITTPFPKHSKPSDKSGYSTLVWISVAGSILSILFVTPVLVYIDSAMSMTLAYSIFPGMLFVLIIGTAGIADNVTKHMGVQGLHTPLLFIVATASVALCVVIVSACAGEYNDRNFGTKTLGLTGGQWRDIFILSVLTLFMAHFLVTLVFWIKVRSRVKGLPTPTTTPPAP